MKSAARNRQFNRNRQFI